MMSGGDLLGTFVGVLETIVLAPILLAFIIEYRKKRHAVDLIVEVKDVAAARTELAGLDELLEDIRDLIDRAQYPKAYTELRLGNEILIAGPPLSGKKTLAEYIARTAKFDRIIIVHNPSNTDALVRAKQLALRSREKKIMLLLPRLHLVDERAHDEVLAELDALIEAVSELSHALVVGTTSRLVANGAIDNLFGTTLALPGAPIIPVPPAPLQADSHRMLAGVAEHYLDRTLDAGYALSDISREGFVARLLISVINPAQIEDIVVLCQAAAIYRQRIKQAKGREISAEMLEIMVRRVVTTDEVRSR